MALAAFPRELIVSIFEQLEECDINALFQTNAHLYDLLSEGDTDALMKFIAYGLNLHACGQPSNFAVNKALLDIDSVAGHEEKPEEEPEEEKEEKEEKEEEEEESLFLRYHDETLEFPKQMPPSHDNQCQHEPLPQPEPLICYAAKNGNVSIMQTLLAHGVYPDIRNKKGEMPLIIASRERHEDNIVIAI
ncbi:uncharacterized protein EURHEDRAFT_541064 [Aspergillus ruber CBS 135680]|uniref:F-box domain-containing protein n=1 Tax=Aspergillus ruber (strain CBS 135680) TaxID=1388766 RepID=A0A017SRM0_ASPRC|nr:uncharacterized protein EURHEDRAFT_541064 [Aspergillus ruber CBS 135680]EYE99234.1 hypothetical protein EURHEDRAFT_541064 [Aspergillus ruber CBS 135680]